MSNLPALSPPVESCVHPTVCQQAQEIVSRAIGMGNPRLPAVHPGCPGHGTVELVARVVKRTPNATLVELPDDPRGRVWLSRKHVFPGGCTHRLDVERMHVPVWLYRKIREQL